MKPWSAMMALVAGWGLLCAPGLAPSLIAQLQPKVSSSLTPEERAELGDAEAQNLLGLRALSAQNPNYTNAVRWFRLAAEQGWPIAQHNLGGLYFRGNGVPQDYKEAMKWYQKAAQAGFAPAQSFLGWIYATGKCVEQDTAEAIKWYLKAAEQGDKEAQYSLGLLHLDRDANYVEAYKWINLSAAQGNTNAIKSRARLTLSMTAEQVAEGQRRASEFAAKKSQAGQLPKEAPKQP